jgi:hypothetical protein
VLQPIQKADSFCGSDLGHACWHVVWVCSLGTLYAYPLYGITALVGPLRHGNRVDRRPELITEDYVCCRRPWEELWRSVRPP